MEFDSFMTYFDPYQDCEIGVIIENKHYSWKSVNKSAIQEWVDNLIQTLECVPYSEEFRQKLNFNNALVNTGLLMVWCHDDFDEFMFSNYLNNISLPKKHKLLRVFALGNSEILKLYSISKKIKELNNDLNNKGRFDIFYPSYRDSDSLRGSNLVSLEYFKSKYIFGKLTRIKPFGSCGQIPENITVVFYFDKLTFECLEYMYLALRRFQLTDSEILIYHYDDPQNFKAQMNEFARKFGEHKISFEPMDNLSTVPWRISL
jgi:hypothetical protein